jgi:hypothetical protein
MPSVKQDHSAHSGDRRSSTHSRPSPKSRRGLPAVRIWSRRFRWTWVKKIMLLNYYFFNLRHSALLVLTVNDNEMTLDQIRSAKLQHVSTATTHRLCLGTPQAWAESASHRVALVLLPQMESTRHEDWRFSAQATHIHACALDFEFCDTWYHRQLGPYIPIDFEVQSAAKAGVFGPSCFQFSDNSRTV